MKILINKYNKMNNIVNPVESSGSNHLLFMVVP